MALTDSLISFWELEEASGTRNDSHGTNHLTDVNTVLQGTGKVGNCADIEGSNSEQLTRADNASLSIGASQSFTICVWTNMEDVSPDHCLVGKADGSATAEYYCEYSGGPTNRFAFRVFGGAGEANGTEVQASNLGAVVTGVWHFLVYWLDVDAQTINVQGDNGTPNSAAHTFGCWDGSGTFRIGASAGGGGFYDGLIDQVGFWKRVLTTQERTDLYNGGAGMSYAAIAGGGDLIATPGAGSVPFTGRALDAFVAMSNDARIVIRRA